MTASAGAQLLEEHFNYANGSLGAAGVGNAVWTGGDSPASALTVNPSAALMSEPAAFVLGGDFKAPLLGQAWLDGFSANLSTSTIDSQPLTCPTRLV